MGVSVLILGQSGSGKSTSMRNFEADEIGIFNVAGKPLPFRKALPKADGPTYGQIMQSLHANKLRAYAIDDANYLMAFQNFAMANQSGYGKFTQMAVNFEQLLEAANRTGEDTRVYFLMHPDYDEAGRMKAKTIGKMLDNQLTVEGMFPIVLVADVIDGEFVFRTKNGGNDPVKAPMDMFGADVLPNDLKAVDSAIREYWGLEPLKAEEKAEKKPKAGDAE